jgi:hypothetical protein
MPGGQNGPHPKHAAFSGLTESGTIELAAATPRYACACAGLETAPIISNATIDEINVLHMALPPATPRPSKKANFRKNATSRELVPLTQRGCSPDAGIQNSKLELYSLVRLSQKFGKAEGFHRGRGAVDSSTRSASGLMSPNCVRVSARSVSCCDSSRRTPVEMIVHAPSHDIAVQARRRPVNLLKINRTGRIDGISR